MFYYLLYLLFSSWGIIVIAIVLLLLYLCIIEDARKCPYGNNIPKSSCRPEDENDPNFYNGEQK